MLLLDKKSLATNTSSALTQEDPTLQVQPVCNSNDTIIQMQVQLEIQIIRTAETNIQIQNMNSVATITRKP